MELESIKSPVHAFDKVTPLAVEYQTCLPDDIKSSERNANWQENKNLLNPADAEIC